MNAQWSCLERILKSEGLSSLGLEVKNSIELERYPRGHDMDGHLEKKGKNDRLCTVRW